MCPVFTNLIPLMNKLILICVQVRGNKIEIPATVGMARTLPVLGIAGPAISFVGTL